MLDKHRDYLIRQSVLSIYSSWEGFLKDSLQLYLQELNKLDLSYDKLSDEYLAYQTDSICLFKNSKTSHETVKKLSRRLFDVYNQTVDFDTTISTESNANLKVTNILLARLSLALLSDDYEKRLNKLLRFRNTIAHGDDKKIPIEQKNLDDFSLLVQNMASDIIVSILEGYENSIYLKA